MLRATLAQHLVAEPLCCLLVEDAVLLKYAEGISIQHLRPFITIVSCSIAPSHDVRELHRHTGVLQLLPQDSLLPGLFLEGDDIGGKLLPLCVIGHIQQSERHLSQTRCSSHEVAALHDTLYQLVGQRFPRLVVEGEGTQKLLLDSVVLHELRRQLHEVPPYIRAAETLETGIGEHAVQGVAELMKECLHFTECQQGRLLLRGLGEVHHHADVRTDVLTFLVDILSLKLRHPRTALLALARMEISIEYGQERAVLVEHLVRLDVGMIHGNVLVFLEGYSVQLVSQSEDPLDDVLQLEIRTQHLLIQVVFLHL